MDDECDEVGPASGGREDDSADDDGSIIEMGEIKNPIFLIYIHNRKSNTTLH